MPKAIGDCKHKEILKRPDKRLQHFLFFTISTWETVIQQRYLIKAKQTRDDSTWWDTFWQQMGQEIGPIDIEIQDLQHVDVLGFTKNKTLSWQHKGHWFNVQEGTQLFLYGTQTGIMLMLGLLCISGIVGDNDLRKLASCILPSSKKAELGNATKRPTSIMEKPYPTFRWSQNRRRYKNKV